MRLPIETSNLTFIVVAPPQPVLDFDSKQPRVDANGQPVFTFGVVALGSDGADIINVKVSDEPKGLVLGGQVRVSGLVATTWAMGDRNGVSFRAERVEVLSGPATKAPVAA